MTPTQRLAARLQDALLDLLPEGTQVEEPVIYPSRGYWRHVQQDVMPWQASATVRLPDSAFVQHLSLGSWDTITQCVRQGFEMVDERGNPRKEVDIAVHRKGTKKGHPSSHQVEGVMQKFVIVLSQDAQGKVYLGELDLGRQGVRQLGNAVFYRRKANAEVVARDYPGAVVEPLGRLDSTLEGFVHGGPR